MLPVWPNGKTTPTHVWHRYGPRKPIQTPNGPTSSFHGGIDMGPWDGWGKTWLLAPINGVVTRAAYDNIFGNRVIVTANVHGDTVEFWLCHGRNGTIQVRAGQSVRQFDRLMLMGETGKASGEHIHYEVHVNGKRVDPEVFYRDVYARPSGGGGSVVPITPEEEEETMNSGVYYESGPKTIIYLVFNTQSGWFHEFSNGTGGGAMPPAYNNALATALGTPSWAKVTQSHARVIKNALASVQRNVVSGDLSVTIAE